MLVPDDVAIDDPWLAFTAFQGLFDECVPFGESGAAGTFSESFFRRLMTVGTNLMDKERSPGSCKSMHTPNDNNEHCQVESRQNGY